MPAPSAAAYSRTQIALHWAVVLLILFQYVFPDAISAAFGAAMRGTEIAFDPMVPAHIVSGVLVLVFALWRLWLRLSHGVPPLPAGNSALIHKAAHAGHVALYALMILVPLSGMAAWMGGIGAAAGAHLLLKTLLMLLIMGHVAMALYHQFVLKDGLLSRMRPG